MSQTQAPKEFKFQPVDVGEFYHRILETLHKQLESAKKNFANVSEQLLLEILNKEIVRIRQNDK